MSSWPFSMRFSISSASSMLAFKWLMTFCKATLWRPPRFLSPMACKCLQTVRACGPPACDMPQREEKGKNGLPGLEPKWLRNMDEVTRGRRRRLWRLGRRVAMSRILRIVLGCL
eukprot:7917222-Lingulodinium_polyedra.AAC.1